MMKRKLALLVLCLLLCLALTGCYTEKDPWIVNDLPSAPSVTAVPQGAQEPAQSFQTPTPEPVQTSQPVQTSEPAAEPGLNG